MLSSSKLSGYLLDAARKTFFCNSQRRMEKTTIYKGLGTKEKQCKQITWPCKKTAPRGFYGPLELPACYPSKAPTSYSSLPQTSSAQGSISTNGNPQPPLRSSQAQWRSGFEADVGLAELQRFFRWVFFYVTMVGAGWLRVFGEIGELPRLDGATSTERARGGVKSL